MSDESKEQIVGYFQGNKGLALSTAIKIAQDYAASGNASADSIPYLIENLVHLFVTGQTPDEY